MAKNELADGVSYEPPTTLVDLARYLDTEAGNPPPVVDAPVSYEVEGNDTSAYVGVAPEYQTYGDPTQQPFGSEDGPEAEIERRFAETLATPKTGQTTTGAAGTSPAAAPVTPADTPQKQEDQAKVPAKD
jgi:hypothetical protein